MKIWQSLSKPVKGILAIVLGGLLLLDRFGWINLSLRNVISIAAVGLIAYGVYAVKLIPSLTKLLSKKTNPNSNDLNNNNSFSSSSYDSFNSNNNSDLDNNNDF